MIALISPETVLGHVHYDFLNFLDSPDTKSHRLGLLPRDHQKALRLDQKVLTPSGWVETGDIKVGDLVIGLDGLPQMVIGLYPVSKMELYKIRTRDGREVICNLEHLWTVQCPSNTGNKLVTKSLSDILTNWKSDRLDKRNGKSYTEYRYFLPTVKPIQFSNKDLPIDPYTLGAWLGDGDSRDSCFTTADPEILQYIPYPTVKYGAKYRYRITEINKSLKELNLHHNKHIPEQYLFGSIEQREALLQGLLDTDGSVHIDGKWVYFSQCVKREKLVNDVVSLVRSLGGSATKSLMNTKLNGTDFPSFSLTIKLPNSVNPFRLKRKADKFKGSTGTRSAIVSIEKVESCLGRCITVENSDGLFVTEDYTLTHNSRMAAFYVIRRITKDPWLRVLYISSTSNLAEKQLKFIKDKLESKTYRRYWPNHINERESDRERWTASEISLDHPVRKQEGLRDPTVFTAGLTTSITGLHADIIVLDDVVVYDNAYTEEGRDRVNARVSLIASIEGAESEQVVVGTRYHPRDAYGLMQDMKYDVCDDKGESIGTETVYSIFQRQVEEHGEFLWPRQQRPSDGKWFGFDWNILNRKKAQYLNRTQFYAQYYNNPNNPEATGIAQSRFQYYNKEQIQRNGSNWYIGNKRLNIAAAMDLAYSTTKEADFSSIAVLGIDSENNYYILDIDRFKTGKISTYYERLFGLYAKWNFRKVRLEVTAGQRVIVEDLKTNYIRPNGLMLSIDEYTPTRHMGTKQERMNAILEPRYSNLQMWHYRGGHCQILEDELTLENPPHDDVKNVVADCIEILKAPSRQMNDRFSAMNNNIVSFNSRFGGVA
jgi:hypothetical protein